VKLVRLGAADRQAGAVVEPGQKAAIGLALERRYVIEVDDVGAMDAREALAVQACLEPVGAPSFCNVAGVTKP